MTISSMTGFGRSEGTAGDWRFHWEVRAVNGKGLDCRVRMPSGLEALEQPARRAVSARFSRGNIQVSLAAERLEKGGALSVNEDALVAAVRAAEVVSKAGGGAPVSSDAIFSCRGVLEVAGDEETPDMIDARNAAMLAVLDAALDELADIRQREGERLAAVIAGQLDAIEQLTAEARDSPARAPEAIRERLAANIARLTDAGAPLDEDRLYQEAVLLAAKADIQEELDRLDAHVAAARDLLGAGSAVGRKLDFLAQEFNREANTLCSKSTGTEITRIGLDLKSAIDQLREQVQNIE